MNYEQPYTGYPGHLFKLVIRLIAVALYVSPVSVQNFPGDMMTAAASVIVEHDIPCNRVPHATLVALSGLVFLVVDTGITLSSIWTCSLESI